MLGLIWGVIGFVAGAAIGDVGAEPEPRTVTVTSIVTSLVPTPTTATTQPPATETTTDTTSAPATTRRPRPATTTTRRPRPPTTRPPAQNCDPSYPDFCIPPPPPDLDCADVGAQDFTVREPDPHGFDREGDGVGCES